MKTQHQTLEHRLLRAKHGTMALLLYRSARVGKLMLPEADTRRKSPEVSSDKRDGNTSGEDRGRIPKPIISNQL